MKNQISNNRTRPSWEEINIQNKWDLRCARLKRAHELGLTLAQFHEARTFFRDTLTQFKKCQNLVTANLRCPYKMQLRDELVDFVKTPKHLRKYREPFSSKCL